MRLHHCLSLDDNPYPNWKCGDKSSDENMEENGELASFCESDGPLRMDEGTTCEDCTDVKCGCVAYLGE